LGLKKDLYLPSIWDFGENAFIVFPANLMPSEGLRWCSPVDPNYARIIENPQVKNGTLKCKDPWSKNGKMTSKLTKNDKDMISLNLVGGIPTPLKNMSSSVGIMKFPTEWKIMKFI
jgi:hypothetical protein